MAINIRSVVGIDLNAVGLWPPVPVGTMVKGNDGHDYVFVKASAAIGAATVSVVTEPAFTAAPGAGAWTSGPAIPSGSFGWLKRTAI